MKRSILAFGVALLALADARAVDCANAVTTPDMNECAAREQKVVEAKLNRTYQQLLKDLNDPDSAGTKKKLVAAQRAWVKFREADCAAVYEHHSGGTIRNLVYSGCMRGRAEQRITELEAFNSP